MDVDALGHSAFLFIIGLFGGSVFLFFTSGLIPEYCIITTNSNNCLGLASIFPRGIQGLLFLLLILWCGLLAYKEYNKQVQNNLIKKKNSQLISKLQNK